MYVKYFIRDISHIIALKYSLSRQKLVVGGHIKNREFMVSILSDYFDLSGKIRWERTVKEVQATIYQSKFIVTLVVKKRFDKAIEMLEEHGFDVEKVKILGRFFEGGT